MVGCVHPAAGRRVTGSCRDFTLDGVKFRVVCRGNLEIELESDTQVGLLAILFLLPLPLLLLRLLLVLVPFLSLRRSSWAAF